MQLWIAYQLLRFSVWLMPRETGTVLAHVINGLMDMANDARRRQEFVTLVQKAQQAADD